MIFNPNNTSNLLLILSAWGAAFLAALWLSLIIWTYRDIRARARDPLIRILAVIVVALLFLPGIVIYLILRPSYPGRYTQQTLKKKHYFRRSRIVLLAPDVVDASRSMDVCPNCHTKLRRYVMSAEN
jgi:hypothetical protein